MLTYIFFEKYIAISHKLRYPALQKDKYWGNVMSEADICNVTYIIRFIHFFDVCPRTFTVLPINMQIYLEEVICINKVNI